MKSGQTQLPVDRPPQQTTEHDIGEPLAAALSDYMMVAFGRRPTKDEMEAIYWSAVEAIEEAANHG